MAFYFFTDYNVFENQLQQRSNPFISQESPVTPDNVYSGAFGKINYAHYGTNLGMCIHLGDTHITNSNIIEPYAYAICEGIVAIVPVKNSNLVNLILKPTGRQTLKIPKIKYFIYRGILRDSILRIDPKHTTSGSPDFIPETSGTIVNENINYVLAQPGTGNNDRNNLLEYIYRDADISDLRDSDILLYKTLKEAATESDLDNYFNELISTNKNSNRVVKGGWVLGKFPSSQNNKPGTRLDRSTVIPSANTNFWHLNVYGLDIVLDTLSYYPKLSLVKKDAQAVLHNYNILKIDPYTSEDYNTSNKNTHFAMRTCMETALNFIDPAAFWGSFYKMYSQNNRDAIDYTLFAREFGDAFETSAAQNVKAPIFRNINSIDIYEKILKGPHSNSPESKTNFANKNRVYVDIRNQYNDSYNLYFDNCYNSSGQINNAALDVTKNILYNINDGRTTGQFEEPTRTLLPRNYYNKILPWLIFEVMNNDPYNPSSCDNQAINGFPQVNSFDNHQLNSDYSFSIAFPTAASPLKEQYSLFTLCDMQWRNATNKNRVQLSPDNQLDTRYQAFLNYLHYNEAEPATGEVKIYINTVDRPTGVRLPVAGFYRMVFIKHRTKLYPDTASDTDLQLPTHLPATSPSLRPVKIPRSVEFLDYVFDLHPSYFAVNTDNQLYIRASEEFRYADITRQSGRDLVGQTVFSKNATGDIVFSINGQYNRQGHNHLRINLADTFNINLAVDSGCQRTDRNFLQYLVSRNPGALLRYVPDNAGGNIEMLTSGAFNPASMPAMQLEYFSFIKINSADWGKIKTKFDEFITNDSSVKYYKISLCLNQVHNDCVLPNKYYYWLKGYKVTGNFIITDINEPLSDTESQNRFVTTFNRPGAEGSVNDLFVYAQNPLSRALFSTINSVTQFGSTIYLIRGMSLTFKNYYKLCKAVETDLKKVFSSSTNMGLGDLLMSGVTAIQYEGNILQAIPPKFSFLRNAEVAFLLACRSNDPNGVERSNANNRLVSLFVNPIENNFSDKYVPSHEYAHILGLNDRYAYKASMKVEDNRIINRTTGQAIPLFIPGDTDYNTNYRWYFNLMSRSQPVGVINPLPFANESDFNSYYLDKRPVGVPDTEYGYYSQFTIFITPQQWQVISNNAVEPQYFGNNNIFFLPANVIDNISFVGNSSVNGSGTNFSDANFSGHEGTMQQRNNGNILGILTYVNADQIMADMNLRTELIRGGFLSEGILNRSGIGASIDLTGNNDRYQNNIAIPIRQTNIGAGQADPMGMEVWNKVTPAGLNPPARPFTNPRLVISFDLHQNRIWAIEIISLGN